MLRLNLAPPADRPLSILCLGAHSDDIEIGCGGTLLRLLAERDDVDVHWLVLGARGVRQQEALVSADAFLAGAHRRIVDVRGFRDGYFPYLGAEIKDAFEELKATVAPDLIFTHHRHDLHQDHRLVCELTWNTFRDHLILEYEVMKYDGDLGRPNLFVHLEREVAERKVAKIMAGFPSQASHAWFTADTFLAMLRLRGVESNAPARFAEGFHCRKAVIW